MSGELILVDSTDQEIGYATVTACHYRSPKRHRAVSLFLFNHLGEMLITQRSSSKKTWPLHWSNACCGHPLKEELCEAAAARRMRQELGVEPATLEFLFKFEYAAQYSDEWGEHEIDWVFASFCEGPFPVNAQEVADWRFISVEDLLSRIGREPERFTPWFRICLDRVLERGPYSH